MHIVNTEGSDIVDTCTLVAKPARGAASAFDRGRGVAAPRLPQRTRHLVPVGEGF